MLNIWPNPECASCICSNVVKKTCHVRSSFCIKLDYKHYLKWRLDTNIFLDRGSALFSIVFFYFYILIYKPYQLNFGRWSFSSLRRDFVIFNQQDFHIFSDIPYCYDIYLLLMLCCYEKLLLLCFFHAICVSLALCSFLDIYLT